MAARNLNEIKPITEKKCENSIYGNNFLNALNKMRINQKHCDFSLDVKGEIIHVHKLALEIASPYFAAMFGSDMKEAREGAAKLEDMDIIDVKALVEYMYSGSITITKDNVEALFSTSNLFEIEWVKKQCEEFLKRNLNTTNCFRIQRFADLHSLKELYDSIHKYILDHFDDLIDEEELLLLPFQKIQELISDDQLLVKCEENVYKAAINWLKHDIEERKVHLPELMHHIRLPLISTQFLQNHVAAEPLLIEDLECNKLLMKALFHKLASVEEGKDLSDKFRIRKGIEYHDERFYVFLVGSLLSAPNKSDMYTNCKIYDISRDKLISISNMNENRSYNSTIALNGIVYSMGGYNEGRLRTAECYDPINKRWNYIAPMTNERHSFGICSYNDFVYVVSGYFTSTVECYNPAIDKWSSCPNIPNEHSSYTRATLLENSIYSLVDGCNSASCLRFDPREEQWYGLNMMLNKSDRFQIVSFERTLFYIGSKFCKRLDVRMNTWESMPPMHGERYDFSAVIAADNIYVLGGSNVKNVERYNIVNNEWTIIDSMVIEHYRGGAAVLSGDFEF